MAWTKEQETAIYKDGTNIIVSAGAGSGKTAVLTERVLEKVKNGISVDNLLILTFTKMAAKEMRERIGDKLKKAGLTSELSKLDTADITTFDAYALSLVKKYHYYLNVSKDISIIDASVITLYKDVIFDSNITVPANKNIKLYLNGHTLNKGSYDFTGEGKITVIDGTSTNALASIIENVKEVLNIGGINKNIIIYEMDDGSAISSESTYKLYKDNEEVMLEEDAIGIYSVGNSNDEIRSANKKIYINELPKGKYKLIGDNNKEVKFEIDESGKIIGSVKENTKETSKIVSTAVAELIIMIQTGIEKVNYIMIILTLLVTISSLLYIVKKVNVNES